VKGLPQYGLGAGDFTIEMWFSTTSGGTLLSFGLGDFQLSIAPDGTLQLTAQGQVVLKTTQARALLVSGLWTHLAIVRANKQTSVVVNGVIQAATATQFALSGAQGIWFGTVCGTVDGAFTGQLAEVRFWNTARGPALREDMLYRFGLQQARLETGLIGCWSFNGDAADLTFAQNSAQLSAAAAFTDSLISNPPPFATLFLDATTPSVTIVGRDEYNVHFNDFYVEAWACLGSSGTIISRQGPGVGGFELAVSASGIPSFRTTGGTDSYWVEAPDVNVLDGRWHHLAGARYNRDLLLFVDGVQVAYSQQLNSIDIHADRASRCN
jgi:hypothetical protein